MDLRDSGGDREIRRQLIARDVEKLHPEGPNPTLVVIPGAQSLRQILADVRLRVASDMELMPP